MNLKLAAFPILVLLISLFMLGPASAETSNTNGTSGGTTSNLRIDMGNGNIKEIPYSISGATVTDSKVDTSIPKIIINISATEDGQITLQIPGGPDSDQNDITILVDGQSVQYTQSFDSGHRMATIPFHSNSSTIEIVGNHRQSQENQNMQNDQPNTSCSQDDMKNAEQELSNLEEKMNAFRTQFYNDWQTANSSGQYNGTWEQYSHEKLMSSPDVAQLKSDYEKYNSVLRDCGVKPIHFQPNSPQNSTCSSDDINHARDELVATEKQGYELKNKIYQQFQQDQSSGKFNGTWNQYAQENFWNIPDVSQIKADHEKYSGFLKSCFGQTPIPQQEQQNLEPDESQDNTTETLPPDESQDNTTTTLPSQQSQDISSITPSDALAISGIGGIPGWVKQMVGWWVQGKISDSDFVTLIKYLIHQGIIKP